MRYVRIVIVGIFTVTLIAFAASSMLLNYNADTESPVITSDSDEIRISDRDGKELLLKGLKATDNRDGDLTEDIFIGDYSPFTEKGVCKVKYLVFDSSNNVGTYIRTVTYTDYTSPEFQLSKPLTYEVGAPVTVLDRLSVQDCIEGDITDKIKIISSDVNKMEPGIYRIGVEASNSFGDTVSLSLPVNVVEQIPDLPTIQLSRYMVTLKKGDKFDSTKYIDKLLLPDGSEGNRDEIHVESDVNMSAEGTYQTVYSYTGTGGNMAVTSLTVVVRE